MTADPNDDRTPEEIERDDVDAYWLSNGNFGVDAIHRKLTNDPLPKLHNMLPSAKLESIRIHAPPVPRG